MSNRAAVRRPGRSAWFAEFGATLALALPLILTNLAQTGLGTADVVLLGRLGPDAVAAAALGTNLYFAAAFTGSALVSAVAPLASEALGRKRRALREVRRTVRQGLWSCLLVALPIWAVLWHGEALLRLIGQDRALAAEAGRFVRTLQWGLLPFLGFAVLRAFMAALQRPGPGLAIGLAALPVNVGLAVWLIGGGAGVPALGLVGAGLASTLTAFATLAAACAVIVKDRRFRRFRLFGRFWRPDPARLRRLWALGVPIAGTILFEVSLFNAAAFAVGTFGAVPLAAHAVAIQVASLAFMVPLGIGQAATVRVGRAFGARDRGGIVVAGGSALLLGCAFALGAAAAMYAQGSLLAAAFLPASDAANAAAADLAVHFLLFAAVFQLADSLQAVASGALRGLQDTRVPLLLASLGYWGVGAPVGLWLAFGVGWQGSGVWAGLALGLAAVAGSLVTRWFRLCERLGHNPVRDDRTVSREAWTAV